LALGELEATGRRPCLVMAAGLPGSGKSTLARNLVAAAGFQVIRSDVVRKELAGLPPTGPRPAGAAGEIYTPAWTERTYAECLRRAEQGLFEGQRVLVDASFREEGKRRAFLDAAGRWGVPAALLHCQADPDTIRLRLQNRRGDASDADWAVYRNAAGTWEEAVPQTRQAIYPVPSGGSEAETLAHALGLLKALNLM
jgi:predicted kinase